MSTDWNKTEGGRSPSLDQAKSDASDVRGALGREREATRAQVSQGVNAAREGAADIASKAKGYAYEEADRGKDFAAGNIEDFAAAIRKASDELGGRDQSLAAGFVRQAAGGLEDVSRSLKGQSIGDIVQSVAGFARRQPTAFLLGAALAGVAIGRFARASGEHSGQDYPGASDGYGYDDNRRFAASGPAPTGYRPPAPLSDDGSSSPSAGLGARPSPTIGSGGSLDAGSTGSGSGSAGFGTAAGSGMTGTPAPASSSTTAPSTPRPAGSSSWASDTKPAGTASATGEAPKPSVGSGAGTIIGGSSDGR